MEKFTAKQEERSALGIKRIGVFCGSSPRVPQHFTKMAYAVGECIANSGLTLIYGGGQQGSMGAVADGCLAGGGEVHGVITSKLMAIEVGHAGLTSLAEKDNMASRRSALIDLSDAFLVLPGGVGTLDELFEVMTLNVLAEHNKPVGLLNCAGYYDALLDFLYQAVDAKFVSADGLQRLQVSADPDELLAAVVASDD